MLGFYNDDVPAEWVIAQLDYRRERTVLGAIVESQALQTGREPQLSARKALPATETLFACCESSRRRGHVALPLTIDDNPLQAMVAGGEMRPEPAR